MDENVTPCLMFVLQERGHDASCAGFRADLEGESDEIVLAQAAHENRVVITHNYGHYEPLHAHYREVGRPHAGIIVCTEQDGYRSFARFLRWMSNLLATVRPDEFRNNLYYLHTSGP